MSLFNALNLGDVGIAAGGFPPPPLLLLDTPEIEPRGATAPILSDEGMVSPGRPDRAPNVARGHPDLEDNSL